MLVWKPLARVLVRARVNDALRLTKSAGPGSCSAVASAWRMSFRCGNQGPSMWRECLRVGVAALTYGPVHRTDLSKYGEGAAKGWDLLFPPQKASLKRVAYQM